MGFRCFQSHIKFCEKACVGPGVVIDGGNVSLKTQRGVEIRGRERNTYYIFNVIKNSVKITALT